MSSTDYDVGTLEVNGDGTVSMNFSNCPPHNKEYKLQRGKLVMFDEKIGPTTPGGCAACFTGNAQVAINADTSVPIQDLQRGDEILKLQSRFKTISINQSETNSDSLSRQFIYNRIRRNFIVNGVVVGTETISIIP